MPRRPLRAPASLASALLLLAACASVPRARPYAGPDAAVDALVRRASLHLQEGRVLEAHEAARAAVAMAPRSAEAQRVLQGARLTLGDDHGVVREAEAAVAAAPGDGLALYLAGRVADSPERARDLLRGAVAADPGLYWARVALAQVLVRTGALRAAGAHLREAEACAPGHPWTSLVAASLALAREDPEGALARLHEAVARDPSLPASWEALAARLARVPGGESAAREALARAFALAPGDGGIAREWRRLLEDGADAAAFDAAMAAVDASEAASAPGGPARHLRGVARRARGDLAGAIDDLAAALEEGSDRTAALEDLRLALLAGGFHARAAALEAAETPAAARGLPGGPTDLARERLLHAARAADARPDDAGAAAALAAACRALGWHREAAVVARRHVREPGSTGEAAAELRRTEATLRFLAALRASWRVRYLARESGDSGGDVDDALEELRDLSRHHLGIDLTDGMARRSFGILGEMADTVRAAGPCGRWFRENGLALVVGRAIGGPVEARLLRVVGIEEEREYELLGRRFRATVVVGEGLLVPSWREAGGMILGGFTAGDLVFLDLEGVGRFAGAATRAARPGALRDRLRLVPELPAGAVGDGDELRFPGLLPERIAAATPAWADRHRALADFLDAARAHELAHAAQAAAYLPLLARPLAGIGLFMRGGFSGSGVAEALEGDAELAAVAAAGEPRAALSTLVSFLPARQGGTPHVGGYHAAVRDLLAALAADGRAHPNAAGGARLRTLDRVPPSRLRAAALRACAARGFFVPGP